MDQAKLSLNSTAEALEQEREKAILHLIGRGLIDHKETFYKCHQTGLTAEVAWPVMHSIYGYVSPHLTPVNVPTEPTPVMIEAALKASIRLRDQWGVEVEPDSPGQLPAEMVRTVWCAMLQSLPERRIEREQIASISAPQANQVPVLPTLDKAPRYGPVGYDSDSNKESPWEQFLQRAGVAVAAFLSWKPTERAVEMVIQAYGWAARQRFWSAAIWKTATAQQHRIMRKDVGLRH